MPKMARVTTIFTKGYAEVELQDETRSCDGECKSCKEDACLVFTPDGERAVAENYVKAKKGDIVELAPAEPRKQGAAVLVYIVPAVMFAVGFVLSAQFSLGERLLTGAILALMAFVIAWIMNRRARMRKVMRWEVVRVCREAEKDGLL